MLFSACPSTAVGARFCHPTSTCLFADKICDRHQDCLDDSDEANCSSFSFLYSHDISLVIAYVGNVRVKVNVDLYSASS